MKRLLLPLGLWLGLVLLAVIGMTLTEAPIQAANPDGEYGCCCPYSAWSEACPATPGALVKAFDDVCLIVDDERAFVEFCADDPYGVYPYRGMALEEITLAVGPVVDQSFDDVGAMLDFFCGYGWDKWYE